MRFDGEPHLSTVIADPRHRRATAGQTTADQKGR
jgi:hypothetical protein